MVFRNPRKTGTTNSESRTTPQTACALGAPQSAAGFFPRLGGVQPRPLRSQQKLRGKEPKSVIILTKRFFSKFCVRQ